MSSMSSDPTPKTAAAQAMWGRPLARPVAVVPEHQIEGEVGGLGEGADVGHAVVRGHHHAGAAGAQLRCARRASAGSRAAAQRAGLLRLEAGRGGGVAGVAGADDVELAV
jgi:hypothetical protein